MEYHVQWVPFTENHDNNQCKLAAAGTEKTKDKPSGILNWIIMLF
jgi:hypothetical protein